MSSPEQAPSAAEDLAALRSDFLSALGWMALGIAILIGSVMMDRLEKQGINPYTIPGLLPGLLGIAMTILGALLAARSWRPQLLASANRAAVNRAEQMRILLVLGLCLTFGVVLVGHGLPFWLAAAIFVTTAILCLQYQARKSTGEGLSLRRFAATAAIGLGAGIAMTILGALLAARSWRPHLFASAANGMPVNRAEQKRILLVLGLCLAFGVGLVGHGLPFWLAAAIFVTVAIVSLQYRERRSTGEKLSLRRLITAAAIGLGAGAAITVVFQEIFLVRLP